MRQLHAFPLEICRPPLALECYKTKQCIAQSWRGERGAAQCEMHLAALRQSTAVELKRAVDRRAAGEFVDAKL